MARWVLILFMSFLLGAIPERAFSLQQRSDINFSLFGDELNLGISTSMIVPFDEAPSVTSLSTFHSAINTSEWQPVIKTLQAFKEKHALDDWLFYQLVRRTAQAIAPKEENYHRYTLYKWFLLSKTGYEAHLTLERGQLMFYVRTDDSIYDIPYFLKDNKQYVCLNIHDYPPVDFRQNEITIISVSMPEAQKAFSYQVTQMPDFTPADYGEKSLSFSYRNKAYHFKVLVNNAVQGIFNNYPVVDYASYFNVPLSKETYSSLIPVLKKNVEGMKQRKGVDFLMHFTRNAFLYEVDEKVFGKEKRMTPEQTLLHKYSDCDDRAALFFYLVKEVYDLPMLVLLYPSHVTIAVSFDRSSRNSIMYKGKKYSICEPTPQAAPTAIGQVSRELKQSEYQIAYEYTPNPTAK